MKVIRLVEDITWDQLNNKKNTLAKQWLEAGLSQQDFTNQKFSHWEEVTDYINNINKKSDTKPKEYSNVNVNEVRNQFELNKGAAKSTLDNLFDKIGNYGGNDAHNISKVLEPFDVKFIRYFLECLEYENLGDKDNFILTALANKASNNLISGNKQMFTKFFNTVNGAEDDLTTDYLKDGTALIYDKNLYRAARYENQLLDIIHNDVANMKDPAWREAVKANLSTGNIGQFTKGVKREDRQAAQATEIFNNMNNDKKVKWLRAKGVEERTATDAVNQMSRNENSNK